MDQPRPTAAIAPHGRRIVHLGRIAPGRFSILLVLTLTVGLNFGGPTAAAQEPVLFRIGTGGQAGVYYPLGKLIARAVTETFQASPAEHPAKAGYIGVAQSSGGSVANLRALAAGEIEAALVQADVAAWAYGAEHIFAGDHSLNGVRAVASLYPEKLQIVCRRDSGIRSIADLRGKRVSIDETGSGTLSSMRIILEAHGMSEADLAAVYLKPEFTIEKIKKLELQGFAVMAGVPMEAVSRIADLGLTLVPIAPQQAARIHSRFPYLFPGEIPAGVYPGSPATPTLQVHALLVVLAEMPEETVRQLTALLWSDRAQRLLRDGHPQAAAITLATALDGISIPLHPGAEHFYRGRGMTEKSAERQ